MKEETDNDIAGLTNWHRILLISALLSGAGSSILGITKDTSDRYKGMDAARDFALRDERLTELRRDFEETQRRSVKHFDDIERRLRELEKR